MGHCDPGSDRVPRLLRDLKLHWSLRLLLHDHRARRDMSALDHITNTKGDQIAAAQLAVDGEIEQCEFTGSMTKL